MQNKTNNLISIIIQKLPLLTIILLISIKQTLSYNFAGSQNAEIDKIYGQIPGIQSYSFFNNNRTLIIVDIFPDNILTFNFKIYSNDTSIQNSFKNKFTGIYIGFDFLSNKNNFDKYRSDSMICNFNINITSCLDFYYSKEFDIYYKNQIQDTNGYLIQSNK